MPTEERTQKFNPSSVPGLSTEARKALNAAFDAMSNWRTETAKSNEKKERTSHREDGCGCSGARLAGANRRCHPRTNAKHHKNADSNDGSPDGCVGGAA